MDTQNTKFPPPEQLSENSKLQTDNDKINNSKIYFKNTDILRVVLIFSVIIWHSLVYFRMFDNPIFNYIVLHNKYPYIPVDMFFVISGFLLFYTVNFKKESFYGFAKKRLIRFMPPLICVLILFYIVSWFTDVKPFPYENIWTLFLLQNVGITLQYGNIGASWYVSSLFWTSCLFFYSYKNIKKEYFNIILALAVLFCYAFMLHNKIIITITNHYSVINIGMVRAIASMGLGYFIWNFYNDILVKIRFIKLSVIQKIIISAVELYLFVFLIQNLLFRTMRYNNFLLLILLFSILFMLFLVNQGFISRLFNHNFSVILGRYVYCILITHEWLRDILIKVVYPIYPELIKNNPVISYGIYLFVTLLLSILIYHLVEKPALKYFKNKFNII